MQSGLTPDVRNEASNEIRHQWLSAAKARELLHWKPLFTLEGRPDEDVGLAPALPRRADVSDYRCRLCGSDDVVPILDLGRMPLANALLTAGQLTQPEPTYPLNPRVLRDMRARADHAHGGS